MAITSYKAVVGYYNGAGTPNITTAVTGQLSDGWIPIGSPILTDAYGQCTQMMAKTDVVPVIATSAYTVVTAANPQPPDATWDAQGEPLWIDTATYLQAYTKGGSYLQTTVNLASGQVTGILPVAKGGTGAATTLAAATNLQVFSISNNLSEIVNRTAAWLNVRPTGPLPLAGDPVGDYDAATKRWVQNLISTGTTGPTMNGVMNYGVGDFHLRDSRVYIQPYEVVSDGQLLNRTDWPELWAYAQMLSPISDADWLADPAKRGKYSLGDGTTTFRVPDRNGVQVNSIPGLYGRGDGGTSSTNGQIFESAAPNIFGRVAGYSASSYAQIFSDLTQGAFKTNNDLFPAGAGVAIPETTAPLVSGRFNTLEIDASQYSPIYGRSNNEIMGRNFVGVWVIRASGGFVAANTSWSVKNADATAPSSGTTVRGGDVVSEYSNPAGKRFARLYSNTVWGSPCAAVIEAEGAAKHAYKFYEDGTVDFRQSGHSNTLGMHSKSSTWLSTAVASVNNLTTGGVDRILETTASDAVVLGYSIGASRPNGYPTKVGFHQYVPGTSSFGIAMITVGADGGFWSRYSFAIDGQLYGSTNNGDFSYPRNGVSDSRVKHDIASTTVDKSWQNLKALQFVTFIYNNDEQSRTRRGLIAQHAETVDNLYVKTRMYPGKNIGDPMVEQKELDTTPMLLDTMHVVQTLMAKVEALEAELSALKSGK